MKGLNEIRKWRCATKSAPFFRALTLFALCALIPRVHSQPQIEWARTYSLDRAKTNQAIKIDVPDNGSIVVAGSCKNQSNNLDYTILSYSPNGAEQWVSQFDDNGADDRVVRVIIAPGGRVAVTGSTKTIALDSAGNRLWAQPYAARDLYADTNFVYLTGFSPRSGFISPSPEIC